VLSFYLIRVRDDLFLARSTLFPNMDSSDPFTCRSHKTLFGALKHPSVLQNSDNLADFRLSLPLLNSKNPTNIMDTLSESISFSKSVEKQDSSLRTGVDSGYAKIPGYQY
jgi:hypothetical protein